MRLKIATTAFLILGLTMLAGWAWILPRPPKGSSRVAVREYTLRSSIYLTILMGSLLGAGAGAFVIGRRAKQEFLEESKRNFDALVEGTLADHRREPEA
ncbi:MAG: hypothetical protein ACOYON_01280 [Fimbriimonas sp.]